MNSQHTPDLDKIKELVNKVEALALRGVGGEKEAAKEKLKILLKKYGLALKELQSQRKTKRMFSLKNTGDCAVILDHIICDVDPKAKVWISPSIRKLTVWLNPEQFIEVSEKFRYFWKLYVKQKELFLHAFLVKNNLGIDPNVNCSDTMTEEEIDELRKMISAVEKGNFMPENRLLEPRQN